MNMRDLLKLRWVFNIHQTCPILMPELLTLMVKIGTIMADRRFIERSVSLFPCWNLSMLHLEKVENPEMISALDDFIFRRVFDNK